MSGDGLRDPETNAGRFGRALVPVPADEVRSDAARARETEARRRDRAAEARDAAAAVRDQLTAIIEAKLEALERDDDEAGLSPRLRAARQRRRAQATRERAAKARERAARDREVARQDRLASAADRMAADRELAMEGIDYLTGAPLRRNGLRAVRRALDRAGRTHEPVVIAFIDIDHLKAINDRRSHDAGDELLCGVVDCVRAALRPYDLILRYGGDEFVCCVAGDGLVGVRDRFDAIGGEIMRRHGGASITTGLVERASGEGLEALVERADRAMMDRRRPPGLT